MESHIDLGIKIRGIETALCNCRRFDDAHTMLKIISKCGVNFLSPTSNAPNRIDTNPYRRIKDSGSIVVPLTITHRSLGRDAKLFSLGWETPLADLGYIADVRSITIHQTNATKAGTLEEIVSGQISLASQLAAEVGATYGWVDASSEQTLPRKVTSFAEVSNWFYFNLFGPQLVADTPPNFFRDIPAHEKRTLSDGSMVVISAASFAKWVQTKPERLETFLMEKMPQARLFRIS